MLFFCLFHRFYVLHFLQVSHRIFDSFPFQILKELFKLDRKQSFSKFDTREHLYLDSMRVGLYKMALNLNTADSTSILPNTTKLHMETKLPELHMETKLLEMLLQKKNIMTLHDKLKERNLDDVANMLPVVHRDPMNKDEMLRNGWALILNQIEFQRDDRLRDSKQFESREGSDQDKKMLEKTLKMFGCHVDYVQNLKAREIRKLFEDLASGNDFQSGNVFLKHPDFKKYGFVVICVSSHGERVNNKDMIMGADGVGVSLYDDIVMRLSDGLVCPSLLGKLKLFVVQACRGNDPVPTMVVNDGYSEIDRVVKEGYGQEIAPAIGVGLKDSQVFTWSVTHFVVNSCIGRNFPTLIAHV